jgi:hypothetical protein
MALSLEHIYQSAVESSKWVRGEVFQRFASKIENLATKISTVAASSFERVSSFYNNSGMELQSLFYRKLFPAADLEGQKLQVETEFALKIRIPYLSELFRLNFQRLAAGQINDGIEISHKDSNCANWVVYFLSEEDFWQKDEILLKLATIAYEAKVNVVVQNWRKSGPVKEQDLVDDGKSLVRYLLDEKKLRPNEILLHGASLGAQIATGLVKAFELEHLELKLCHERSFSSLGALYGSKIALIGTLTAKLFSLFGWYLTSDHISNYGKRLVVIYHPSDPEIPKSAQLISNNLNEIERVVLSEEEFYIDGHRRMWFDDEYKRYAAICRSLFSS